MEVTMTLKVTKEEYFDYLMDSLYMNLKRSVSRKIKRSDIRKGYHFVNHYKKGEEHFEVGTTISQLEKNRIYELQRSGDFGKQLVRHMIETNPDQSINVTYIEETESNSLFGKIRSVSKKHSEKKMMKKMLKQVETDLISKRI